MKTHFFIFLLFFIFCACSNSPTIGGVSNSPHKTIDGKTLFKKNCVICHGLTGDMQVNGAKDLNQSTLSLPQRIETITKGRKVMPPFKGRLTEKEIEAVAQFTLDRFGKK